MIFIVALTMSMSILGGIGFYASMGVEMSVEGQNEDVQRAADQLGGPDSDEDGISFAEGRSSSILEGPLAVVTPVVEIFQVFTAIVGNTSGVIQLLYGMPKVVGDTIEVFFRLSLLVTILYLIRSGSPY